MVEILAGVLTGANLSFQASSFVDNAGGPPRTGQFFVGIDPSAFLGAQFQPRLEQLLEAIEADPAVRLPGARRLEARERAATQGISAPRALYERIQKLNA
jgi:(2R)-3-sulfolactate dehydrogenase (NADP+)